MNHISINNSEPRKRRLSVITWTALAVISAAWLALKQELIPRNGLIEDVMWTALLLWGAILTGFIFQPAVKKYFAKKGDGDSAVVLKDHETLMGYYPIVAAVVFISSFFLTPLVFPSRGVFEIMSPHFWWATATTGILNVLIFYFFTKGLRFGDISLVSVTQSLNPIVTLPISFLAFALFRDSAPLSNPEVSGAGFLGIVLVIGAIAVNALVNRKPKWGGGLAPAGDWFAHHPVLSGIVSTVFAGVAVNFDKIAVDSANPFFAGALMALIVSLITFGWTVRQSGLSRVKQVFQSYGREFLIVGLIYAGVILVMNVTLFGHNVNYYASIKRASAIFGTLYGIYVLGEGRGTGERLTRIMVSLAVLVGIVLITLKG